MATVGRKGSSSQPLGIMVVGLGHISQGAMLPAFENAANTRLVALVSGNADKRRALSQHYRVPAFDYRDYQRLLSLPEVEAVYIALPNHLHTEYTVKAAQAGVHVLCEKPMALSEEDCEQMIEACSRHQVRLMIAYRLHFEEVTLSVLEAVRSGRIGEPRLFTSNFSLQVKEGNIRVREETGGGPLWDIGVYCLNAVRHLFDGEPEEVVALGTGGRERRFEEVYEAVSVALRFPHGRLATFNVSFGAHGTALYQVVGTEGAIQVDNAYEYRGPMSWRLTDRSGNEFAHTVPERDQFGPQLLYFAHCVTSGREPEPDGYEGLADVRLVRAIHRSLRSGQPVSLPPYPPPTGPGREQQIRREAISSAPTLGVSSAREH